MASKDVVFRAWRRLPNGRILWARNYGLRAWAIPVSEDSGNEKTTHDFS